MKFPLPIFTLSALLALQLGLLLFFNKSDSDLARQYQEFSLLSLNPDSVVRFTIQDNKGEITSLQRQGDGWTVSNRDDFPADSRSVHLILDKISGLKRGAFVATSESALDRFQVTENSFERKVTFEGEEGSLGSLYFGSSRGVRQVHVRREDQDSVAQVSFYLSSLSADPDDWIQNTLLQIEPYDIIAVSWGDVKLELAHSEGQSQEDKTDFSQGNKSADGDESTAGVSTPTPDGGNVQDESSLPPSQSPPSDAPTWRLTSDRTRHIPSDSVDNLISYLSRFVISGLIPSDVRHSYEKNLILAIKVGLRNGETRTYNIFKASDELGYALSSSSWSKHLMRLSSTTASRILEVTSNPAFSSNSPNVPDSSTKAKEIKGS